MHDSTEETQPIKVSALNYAPTQTMRVPRTRRRRGARTARFLAASALVLGSVLLGLLIAAALPFH